jgi:hypothetical protein
MYSRFVSPPFLAGNESVIDEAFPPDVACVAKVAFSLDRRYI